MHKIILVRHAESIANQKGIHQGQIVDTSLSLRGKKQAKVIAEILSKKGIEEIYASDLKRTVQTASELSKIIKVPVILDKRLREFSWGEFDKTPEVREKRFQEMYQEEIAKGKTKYEIRPPKGENIWDFIIRAKSFLEEIKKHDKTVAVFSHGGIINVILNLIEGRDKEKDEFRRYRSENTSFTEIELINGKWTLTSIINKDHVKKRKPQKILYENQEEVYLEARKLLLEKLSEALEEAYLFGSLSTKKFGKYCKNQEFHKASNINVLGVLKKQEIPLDWTYVRKQEYWTIYSAGKISLNENPHKIELFVTERNNLKKAIEELKKDKWNPEKIK